MILIVLWVWLQKLIKHQVVDMEYEDLIEKTKTIALSYISDSQKTEFDVSKRIDRYLENFADFTSLNKEEIKEAVLSYMKESNFIDDLSYSQKYVQQQFSKRSPKSPMEITLFLRKKGISEEDIEAGLVMYTTVEQLRSVRKYINKNKKFDKNRMKKYLLTKGFDYNLVFEVLS